MVYRRTTRRQEASIDGGDEQFGADIHTHAARSFLWDLKCDINLAFMFRVYPVPAEYVKAYNHSCHCFDGRTHPPFEARRNGIEAI